MAAGSGISESVKGTENAGITQIVVNAATDIPAKNNFIIFPPLFIEQLCAFGLRKDGIFLEAVAPPIFLLKIDTPEFPSI
jgi:hypothetical protein